MWTRPGWFVTLVVLVGLAIWLVPARQWSAAAAQDKTVPPEMKVLEKRLGAWTTVARGKAAEWTPQGFESKGDEKIELVMQGRFIQGKVRTQPGDVEATWLATYDTAKKAYRVWYFSSLGDTFDATGKWDAKTKTIIWTSEPQPGITSISHWRFITDDSFEWDVVAKDSSGKVYLDITGKLTRKK
jgi:hypothetical protein